MPPVRRLPATAAAVLAFVLLVVLSGCTSAVDQARAGTAQASPREGGTLRIATGRDLVPATLYSGASDPAGTITGLVYEKLIDYAPDSLEPKPRLATSWTVSPDGRTVTFELRDDVTFHDGRPFTSADVEFSLRSFADPAKVAQLGRTAQVIKAFDTSADHRIVLTLEHPVSNLFDLFSLAPIIDKNTAEQVFRGEAYNGTGPFKFTGWTRGSKLTFAANPDYWGGKPHLDGVDLSIVPDQQTQAAQLRAGQADLLLGPTPRDIEALKGDPGFRIVEATGVAASTYVGFNVQAVPDVRVRRAVALAVDRERILNEVFLGHGRTANLPWPQYSPAYDAAANQTYRRDLTAARALIAEAAPVPDLPLAFISGDTRSEQLAQVLQANLAEIGITVTLQPQESAVALRSLMGGTYEGLWTISHTFAQYNPATLTVSAYPFNSARNSSNFIDADYQAHAEAAWKTADPNSAEAKAAYAAVNRDLVDNAFLVELVNETRQYAASNRLQDFTWSKRSELDLAKAYLTER